MLFIDSESGEGAWMSPADIFINFMNGKTLSHSIGVVLGDWLRCSEWGSDYALKGHRHCHDWLKCHGVEF